MLYVQFTPPLAPPSSPKKQGNWSLNLFLIMFLERSLRSDQAETSLEIWSLEQDPNDGLGSVCFKGIRALTVASL